MKPGKIYFSFCSVKMFIRIYYQKITFIWTFAKNSLKTRRNILKFHSLLAGGFLSGKSRKYRNVHSWEKRENCQAEAQRGEIWNPSPMSTARPTVHTNPSQKRSFPITLVKPDGFENAGFSSVSFGQKTFWKWSLSRYDIRVIFLSEFSLNANPFCVFVISPA